VALLWIRAELVAATELVQKHAGIPAQERIHGKHEVRSGKRRPEERVIVVSGNLPVVDDGSIELQNIIADETPSPEEILLERDDRAEAVDNARRALAALPERERRIIEARYLCDGEPPFYARVADELGISAERVRQLEARAFRLMRDALAPPEALEAERLEQQRSQERYREAQRKKHRERLRAYYRKHKAEYLARNRANRKRKRDQAALPTSP
jgi:RNA polymerase sigma factor (sigma-70 family)